MAHPHGEMLSRERDEAESQRVTQKDLRVNLVPEKVHWRMTESHTSV